MARVGTKGRVTLPIELRTIAAIQIGDAVEIYVDRQGIISIVKRSAGAARGFLKDISINEKLTDEESLYSTINT